MRETQCGTSPARTRKAVGRKKNPSDVALTGMALTAVGEKAKRAGSGQGAREKKDTGRAEKEKPGKEKETGLVEKKEKEWAQREGFSPKGKFRFQMISEFQKLD